MSRINQLNDVLFDQLDRLNKANLTDEQLTVEAERSKAIVGVAKQVIESGKLAIEAEQLRQEYRGPGTSNKQLLEEL